MQVFKCSSHISRLWLFTTLRVSAFKCLIKAFPGSGLRCKTATSFGKFGRISAIWPAGLKRAAAVKTILRQKRSPKVTSDREGRSRAVATLTLYSHSCNENFYLCALILPKSTSELPMQTRIEGLFLADPQYMKPEKIYVLVGMDVMYRLTRTDIRKGII